MTQIDLLTAPPVRQSLTDRLAAYFKARPGTWIDGMELSHVAGGYAWRSRCADVRRKYGMTIENRQRRERWITISEYRYVPEEAA